MAQFNVSNFVKTPSYGDNVIYIYDPNDKIVMSVDPYTSSFFNKTKYVYIMSDGKYDTTNTLEFGSDSEAIQAVYRLNEMKLLFVTDPKTNSYSQAQVDIILTRYLNSGSTLNDIYDVYTPTPNTGDHLVFSGDTWVATTTNLEELHDTNFVNLQTDDIIIYTSAKTWTNFPNVVELTSAGIKFDNGGWVDNKDGSITLPTATIAIYQNENYEKFLYKYIISGGTTGIDFTTIPNNSKSHIVVKYSGGTAYYDVITNGSVITESNIIDYLYVYRIDTDLHIVEAGNMGNGLVNRLNQRHIKTDRFVRENGLDLSTVDSTGTVSVGDKLQIDSGIVWFGGNRIPLIEYITGNPSAETYLWWQDSPTTWTFREDLEGFVNDVYWDSNTYSLLPLDNGTYNINWIYRGIEDNAHCYIVLGNGQYNAIGEAKLQQIPSTKPPILELHGLLVGRIIGKQGEPTASADRLDSAFNENLSLTPITNHNDLFNIQGGNSNDRYHLTADEQNYLTSGIDASPIHNHESLYYLSSVTYTKNEVYTTAQTNANFLSANTILTTTLSGLTDVVLNLPQLGNTIIYSGSNWVNANYDWSYLYSIPTTLSGYGITDVYNKSEVYTKTEIDEQSIDYNVLSVEKNPGYGEFPTINSALTYITNNNSASTWYIKAGSGLFIEDTLVMKPYVHIHGFDKETTIIQVNATNKHVVLGSDFASIHNVTLQGATDTDYCAVYHTTLSGTTNTHFYLNNIKFGSNDTLVHCYSTITPSFVFVHNSFYGSTHQFNKGFIANNNNSVAARVLLMGCSTIGMSTPYPTVFAQSDGINCEIITNAVNVRTGGVGGVCMLATNGATLRLSATNLKGWDRAIATNSGGTAPIVHANGVLIENCTMEIDIQHTGTTGYITGYYDNSKVNIDSEFFLITGKDAHIISVGKLGADFSSISGALNSITNNSYTNMFEITVAPGVYTEPELFMKPYVNIIGSTIMSTIIEPIGNHNMFTFTSAMTEISFMSIQNVSSGYCAVNVDDAGDYNVAHKLTLIDCDTNIKVVSQTKNTRFYAEYIDFNGTYTYGTYIQSNNGFDVFCNAENYYNFPTQAEYLDFVDGSNAKLEILAGGNVCNGVEKTFYSTNGGSIDANSVYTTNALYGVYTISGSSFYGNSLTFENCTYGIYSENSNVGDNIKCYANFVDCTENIRINNPLTTGYYVGSTEYTKTHIISGSTFYVANKDPRIITVGKKGSDFTSVKAAYDTPQDTSDTNRYLIKVGPGEFYEDTIVMRPYIDVEGSGQWTTKILSASGNTIFNACDRAQLHKMFIGGASGTSAVYMRSTISGDTTYAMIDSVTFGSNTIHVHVDSDLYPSIILVHDVQIGGEYAFDGAFKITNTLNNQKSAMRLLDVKMQASTVAPYPSYIIYGSGINTEVSMLSAILTTGGVALGTYGIHLSNGINARFNAVNLAGFQTGVYVDSSGVGPNMRTLAFSMEKNTMDLNVLNSSTSGSFFGGAELSKVYIHPLSSLRANYNELSSQNIGTVTVGDIYQGIRHDKLMSLSQLTRDTATMGLISGGTLYEYTGLTILIDGGYGYLKDSDGYITYISWNSQYLALPATAVSYIEVTQDSLIQYNPTQGFGINTIILGSVYTMSNRVHYLENTPINADQLGNRTIDFFRDALGVIYSSGSIVTQTNTGNTQLSVTYGIRYYGANEFISVGGTGVSFEEHWRYSGGIWRHGPTNTTAVTCNLYNPTGSGLTTLTSGNYAKHSLYVTGEGVGEQYLFVYSQDQYPTLIAAEAGGIPIWPTEFRDSTALIATIVTSDSGITEIRDERPIIGFKASAVSATANHSNLLNLDKDDHTQYFRVDGTRQMSGNIDMNNSNIINVTLIDGIVLSGHGFRHTPNSGYDPIPTAAPNTNLNGSTTNYEGVSDFFARSDHRHAIDSATASVTGLLTNSDWSKFNDKFSQSGGTIHGDINVTGNISGNTIHIVSLTATTLYGNLNYSYLTNKPTTLSGYGITDSYTKTETDTNFLSANTSFYTQDQTNNNFLSANTSFYTQAQANGNFLSANTSFYTQNQANNNFLSANTSGNWLSANTSYYTQSQVNSNFLSANTSYYTQSQSDSNYLSANTSYYTQSQVNTNFLSASTSYYTQDQSNTNFLSANTSFYTQSQSDNIFVNKSGDTMSGILYVPTIRGNGGTGGDLAIYSNRINDTSGRVKILTKTVSSNSGTGAFTVLGGVGIGGSLYCGSGITAPNFYGNLNWNYITNSAHTHDDLYYTQSISDGKYYSNSGGTISGNVLINGTLTLASGETIYGISKSSGLTENSDSYISTQAAIKSHISNQTMLTYDAARSGNVNAPVDLLRSGVATSTTPFIVPKNMRIIAMSLSTSANSTWTGSTYVNGVKSSSISSTVATKAYAIFSTNINAGDSIRLRLDGNTGTVTNPAITIYMSER